MGIGVPEELQSETDAIPEQLRPFLRADGTFDMAGIEANDLSQAYIDWQATLVGGKMDEATLAVLEAIGDRRK
ncbi:TPA: hypothetical protein DCW56_00365 [Candidatus Peregrinibacteria bacterium]|nr:hypothetical protein [Candidatus Peregrinibacteria bacterium]